MGTDRNETINFHLHLLLKIKEIDQYPFTKLIIEKELTQEEYRNLMQWTDCIHQEFLAQTEEGFLDVTPLLIKFVGMLHYKLEPKQTIEALKKEGYYPSLMEAFLKLPVLRNT
ncbi:DUF1878 family protein [Sediminibacillus halophilus]|uniref:DUF1878 family protein n=1 Tax=Sediminibacillus halophilus TaxID=482461 RepID=A0A1G9PPA6_9BACI|nr:DUF1878 family protein [Sediminibacillus halophilus]SDM00610.1 Protein of unknown function [Sediminibacillus halophilus]